LIYTCTRHVRNSSISSSLSHWRSSERLLVPLDQSLFLSLPLIVEWRYGDWKDWIGRGTWSHRRHQLEIGLDWNGDHWGFTVNSTRWVSRWLELVRTRESRGQFRGWRFFYCASPEFVHWSFLNFDFFSNLYIISFLFC